MAIQLEPRHLHQVKMILKKHIPRRHVLIFGSRAAGEARSYSDLDLCILGQHALSLKEMSLLKEAFSESALPMQVDVVDWAMLSPVFRAIMKKTAVKLL